MKLQDSDFSIENIRDFTEYFQKLFENVDPTFLDGIAAIIRHAKEKLENVEIKEIIPTAKERKLTENETIEMIEDFYSYLSPELGEIVHNSGRLVNYTIESEDITESNHENIHLNGQYESVLIGIHEHAHRLTLGEINDREKIDNVSSLSRSYFSEMDAIFSEMLGADYLRKTYGFDGDLTSMRFEQLKKIDDYMKDRDGVKSFVNVIEAMSRYLKFIRSIPLANSTKQQYIDELKALETAVCPDYANGKKRPGNLFSISKGDLNSGDYSKLSLIKDGFLIKHNFGFLLANYMHEFADLNNLQQAREIFEKMVKVSSMSKGLEPEQMKLLVEIGLPFMVTDGCLAMEQSGVEKINDAFDRTLDRYKSKERSSPTAKSKEVVIEKITHVIKNPPPIENINEARNCLTEKEEINKDESIK